MKLKAKGTRSARVKRARLRVYSDYYYYYYYAVLEITVFSRAEYHFPKRKSVTYSEESKNFTVLPILCKLVFCLYLFGSRRN